MMLVAVRQRLTLAVAELLVLAPDRVWRRMGPRLRGWVTDQRLWSLPPMRRQYRSPSVMRRALDALDPGGR